MEKRKLSIDNDSVIKKSKLEESINEDLCTSLSNASFDRIFDEAYDLALKKETNIAISPKACTSKSALEEVKQLPKIKGFGLCCSVCSNKVLPSKMVKLNCGHSCCADHNLLVEKDCPGCQMVIKDDILGAIDQKG